MRATLQINVLRLFAYRLSVCLVELTPNLLIIRYNIKSIASALIYTHIIRRIQRKHWQV